MPPTDASLSAPGRGPGGGALDRLRRTYNEAPVPLKILIVTVCCLVGAPIAILMAPYAIFSGSRSMWATASVTIVGLAMVFVIARSGGVNGPHYTLVLLPIVTAFIAHAGALGRRFAPARTLAWVLGLALFPGLELFQLYHAGTSYIGPGLAWLLASVVLGWRLAKAWQDNRQAANQQQLRGRGPTPQAGGWSPGQPPRRPNPVGGAQPGPVGSQMRPPRPAAADQDGRLTAGARARPGPSRPWRCHANDRPHQCNHRSSGHYGRGSDGRTRFYDRP